MKSVRPSHACPTCATELASIRAFVDPELGLPLVVCPSCDQAHVRTRHPDAEFKRWALQTICGLACLMIRLNLIALAGFGFAISTLMFGYQIFLDTDPSSVREDPSTTQVLIVVVALTALVLFPGIIARLVLLHISRNRALVALALSACLWILALEYTTLYWAFGLSSANWSYSAGFVLTIDAPLLFLAFFGAISLINAGVIRVVDRVGPRIRRRIPSAWVRRRKRFRKREQKIRERGFAV
jgi:hypothetical protein